MTTAATGLLDDLMHAIRSASLSRVRAHADDAPLLNEIDDCGSPYFFEALFHLDHSTGWGRRRQDIVSKLIAAGADPHKLAIDGQSILIQAVFSGDEAVLTTLLEHGVDPNHGCAEQYETVYDAAAFDYYFEAWLNIWKGYSNELDVIDKVQREDPDLYLDCIDELAIYYGRERPRLLYLLREFGALSGRELALRLGGDPANSVRWDSGGWVLTDAPRA